MKKFTLSLLMAFAAMGVNAQSLDGYYNIKSGNGKYVEVKGRKTANPNLSDPAGKAGAVIKVKAEDGVVKELRSQAVDPTGYAKKALNYVDGIVNLVVEKLGLEGEGEILGREGLGEIMTYFHENIDVNLYLEDESQGYRIYFKTPSMQPVVDFYLEHKAKVDVKVMGLEKAVNDAIAYIVDKLGKGASLKNTFKIHTIWERMNVAGLTEPVEGDNEAILAFYQEVLTNKDNVWKFGYQTALFYMEFVEGKQAFQDLLAQYPQYAKYWDLIKQVRPDFKYYIVADGNEMKIISQGNTAIKNNAANTFWTLEEVNTFDVTFNKATLTEDKEGNEYYYTTLYVDFPYTLPDGVKAYYVSSIDDKGYALTEEITGVVPAQTPVLLESENEEAALTISDTDGSAISGNLLHGNDFLIEELGIKTKEISMIFDMIRNLRPGTQILNDYEHLEMRNSGTINNKFFFNLAASELQDYDEVYSLGNVRVLNKNNDKLGFWKYRKGLNGNKAFLYISANSAAGATDVSMFGKGTTDGIEGVEVQQKNDNQVYDLQGRKVQHPANGVFIVNGKKVMFK